MVFSIVKNMKLLGLRSLIYPTDDLHADIKWWSKIIGNKPYFETEDYAGFSVGGYEIGLFPAGKMEDGAITYIGVESVPTAYNQLLNEGCVAHEEPVEVGGGIAMASVKRPNGQIVGVIYNPNFKIKE
mgnify:CR=1 FL=1